MREDERDKLVRNQQLFERANQSIRDLAEAASVTSPVTFLCECSDGDCRAGLRMSLGEYRRAHEGDGRFVIAPGHDIPTIERVVREEQGYVVVEKDAVAETEAAARADAV